jgi:hypothetical protein
VTPPAQKVHFLLGEDDKNYEGGHQPHPLFLEMEELFVDKDGNLEWKETARYKITRTHESSFRMRYG